LINTVHEPTLKSFSPLQCRLWQIGLFFTSSVFVTMLFFIRGGVVNPTRNLKRSWRTDVFCRGCLP
jgi:hypothetical protein